MATATMKRRKPPRPEARKANPVNLQYEERAKLELREALAAINMSYAELAEHLNGMGVQITARGLENKISRGGFSAAFYLMCMDALEA